MKLLHKFESGIWYNLVNKQVIPCETLEEHLAWTRSFVTEADPMGFAAKRVAEDYFGNDQIRISTVFLGMDHRRMMDEGPPVVFETMIFFNNDFSGLYLGKEYLTRCCTYEEALVMHQEAVEYVKKTMHLAVLA